MNWPGTGGVGFRPARGMGSGLVSRVPCPLVRPSQHGLGMRCAWIFVPEPLADSAVRLANSPLITHASACFAAHFRPRSVDEYSLAWSSVTWECTVLVESLERKAGHK